MVFVLFFLSGVAALLYQVVWTKELALRFGVTAQAVATTVSVFMLGLAIGSASIGRLADRVRRPLRAYGLLELGIGLAAILSIAAIEGIEALLSAPWFPETSGIVFALLRLVGAALVLAVPATLMGGTLPMLAAQVVRARGRVGRDVGLLYGVNALGGAVGSMLAGFVTIGALGLRGSLLLGVLLNAVAAALALVLGRRLGSVRAVMTVPGASPPADPAAGAAPAPDVAPPTGSAPPSPPTPPGSPAAAPRPSPHAAPAPSRLLGLRAAFFLAGLSGLAVEVVWTRMLLLNLGSTAQSYAAVLAVVLVGLAAGSAVASRFVERVDPARGYGAALVLTGLATFGGVALWAAVAPSSGAAARWLTDLLPRAMRGNAPYRLALSVVQSGLLLLAPTFLMGCSFPFAARGFVPPGSAVGRRLGSAFAWNTLGSMLGPLLCGFWWLPALGIQKSALVCGTVPLAAGAALLAGSLRRVPRWAVVGAATAALVLAWLAPREFVLARTEARAGGRLLHAEEDVCGSVAVLERNESFERCRQLKVGTTSMITDGFACRRYTRLLGHLPLLLHEDPKDAMLICLGSGMTLSALTAHEGLRRIDCVELSPAVVRAARTWFRVANGGALDDPRVRVIENDGRTVLLASRVLYDVIALEPPPPHDDGVAALYSKEFYELCRARLRPGGMVSQWIPYHGTSLDQARSMLATVRSVFPDATLWELFDGREYCVIGRLGEGPIPFDRVAERLKRPRVRTHLRAVGIRAPEDLFACFVMGRDGLDAFAGGARLVTDDRPGLGYDLSADNLIAPSSWAFQRAIQEASLKTTAHAEPPSRGLAFPSPDAQRAFEERLRPVKAAWNMHALALRLCTLRPDRHPAVFAERFRPPTSLDPDNPYFHFTESRGVYEMARARQARIRDGSGD